MTEHKMMKAGYMLLYHGRRYRDPDEVRDDIKQAFCHRCGKLWNISRIRYDCPYFCPICEGRRNKKQKKKASVQQ